MTLQPGTRLGPYEIVAPIGAGGMGEVYRARDTKLGRDVAVKILPSTLAGDRDRAARFTREAQVLAALNHPHIGAIYGLETRSGDTLNHAHWIAKIYAGLHDTAAAFSWLDRGLAARSIGDFYRDEPVWDPIRTDPRFADLVHRMGHAG